jgi:YD repeat-containing protein
VAYANGASMASSFYVTGGTPHYSNDLQSLNHAMPSTGPQFTYTYTGAHQLFTETASDGAYAWQPPSNGTDSYASANSLNQYPSFTPSGFPALPLGYDAKGNLTSGNIDATGAWSFGYDAENRLLTADKTTGGTVHAAYAYDPLGRRYKKSGTGVTTTYFLSDGTDEIAEYDAAGALATIYVPGPAIDQPIAVSTPNGSGGYTHRYFHTNRQGSVIAMTDDSGTRVEGPYVYDPYK